MTRLALVRHGRTAWNAAGRIQGRTDIALDEIGRGQADAAGRLLAGGGWSAVVSSPLVRAHDTARIIAATAHAPLLDPVDALLERDYGEAEGVSVTDAHERWPDRDYPRSESTTVLSSRSERALERLASEHDDLVIVSHGGFLRSGIAALLGHEVPRIANGEVVLLERRSSAWTLSLPAGDHVPR
ncbi:histidine phosphatase family protein [Planctomonas psychrotolerans]|uniref:histidine phosphatase family protein n=1 Tax=Planctomonas psychrotolerans TaxID=2528712 RepID=UPI001D0CFD32|nr:histidine phosphatase family protein [Planctomonas psychrotolerans]